MLNSQPIEKRRDFDDGEYLDVHSVFYTIQGEGPYCGKPAIFIRLAGCNLQCPGCDTDYTSNRKRRDITDISIEVKQSWMPKTQCLVVITGGEPFRQNITPLCRLLVSLHCHVQIETNGTLAPSNDLPAAVTIVCSPKTGKINKDLIERVDYFKYVAKHDDILADGLPATALDHTAMPHLARPPKSYNRAIYLQPMDSQIPVVNDANLLAVQKSCMEHGHTLQIQLHKIIGMA